MLQATPVLPSPPPPPGVTQIQAPVAGVGPADVYTAMREQRSELRSQLENLEEKRQELRQELQQGDGDLGTNAGIVARIKELDARIAATDAQLAAADLAVAKAAAVPGAVVETPPIPRSGPPEEAYILGSLFMVVTLLPISIAYARRIWRRGATVIAPVPAEMRQQIDSLSNAVETIAHEVERIGEGQRFLTRLFSDQGAARALGAGAFDGSVQVCRTAQPEPRRR